MRLHHLRKRLAIVLSAALMFGVITANSAKAARKNVVIGSLTWSGSQAIEQIMKYVLEDKLNVDLKIMSVAQPALWAALDKGSADIYPDMWMPNQKAAWDKYVEGRKTIEVKLSYDKAIEGFWMPAKIAEEHGIKSVFDLKGKGKMFDTDGNGKGEIWVGPFDWAVTKRNIAKVKNYGMDLETIKIQQWLFLAILKEAMRKDKPIVFYYWQPEWPMAMYELVKLEEPRFDASKPDATEFPPATIYVGISKKMKKRLPKAYKFFMNWYIPLEAVSKLIADLEDVPGNPKKDAAEVAKAWVESHPEIVNDWLKGIQ